MEKRLLQSFIQWWPSMNSTSKSALPKHAPIRRCALTRIAIHVLVTGRSGGKAHTNDYYSHIDITLVPQEFCSCLPIAIAWLSQSLRCGWPGPKLGSLLRSYVTFCVEMGRTIIGHQPLPAPANMKVLVSAADPCPAERWEWRRMEEILWKLGRARSSPGWARRQEYLRQGGSRRSPVGLALPPRTQAASSSRQVDPLAVKGGICHRLFLLPLLLFGFPRHCWHCNTVGVGWPNREYGTLICYRELGRDGEGRTSCGWPHAGGIR